MMEVNDEETPVSFEPEEYDALNNETFGDIEEVGDWEQGHEQFSRLDLLPDDEPEEYDKLNDETFGSNLDNSGNWEQSHEKFALSSLETNKIDRFFNTSVASNAPHSQFKTLEEIECELMSNVSLNSTASTLPPAPQIERPCQDSCTDPVDLMTALRLQNYHEKNPPRERLSHHHVENDDSDPYAGLMNTRERRWLANIQVLQLEGDDPHYDFYFTEFQKRHGLLYRNSGGSVHSMQNSESPKASYIPLQFENSLGKVQVGSVAAPRKVIDKTLLPQAMQAPLRKKLKHVLLELEHMYAALQMYDISGTDVRTTQRRNAAPTPLDVSQSRDPSHISSLPLDPSKLMQFFLRDKHHFITFMSIHKGKVLACRLLRHAPDSKFWQMLFDDLQLLLERDSEDEIFLTLLPYFRTWLGMQGSWQLLCYLTNRLHELIDFAVINKFAVSAIANIIIQAEMLENERVPCRPDQREVHEKFLCSLADRAGEHLSNLQTPVTRIDPAMLHTHWNRYKGLSRKSIQKNIIFEIFALPTHPRKTKSSR